MTSQTTSEISTELSIRLHNVITQSGTLKTFTVGNHRSDRRMQRPRRRHSYLIQVTPVIQQHYTEPENPRHSESSEHKLHCVTTQNTTAQTSLTKLQTRNVAVAGQRWGWLRLWSHTSSASSRQPLIKNAPTFKSKWGVVLSCERVNDRDRSPSIESTTTNPGTSQAAVIWQKASHSLGCHHVT
jgi:hypothetical protein